MTTTQTTERAEAARPETPERSRVGKRPAPNLTPEMIDIHGVCRLSSISFRTLRRMDSAGRMPAPVRCGRRVYWRTSDIRLWIELGLPDRKRFEELKRRRAGEG